MPGGMGHTNIAEGDILLNYLYINMQLHPVSLLLAEVPSLTLHINFI